MTEVLDAEIALIPHPHQQFVDSISAPVWAPSLGHIAVPLMIGDKITQINPLEMEFGSFFHIGRGGIKPEEIRDNYWIITRIKERLAVWTGTLNSPRDILDRKPYFCDLGQACIEESIRVGGKVKLYVPSYIERGAIVSSFAPDRVIEPQLLSFHKLEVISKIPHAINLLRLLMSS